ncbi:hypothetical protein ACIBEJ_12485 [Nonomuraea sp. NPDC050790]
MDIRALVIRTAAALAVAAAMMGSSDPATLNVQAIVDRLNLYVLTS